MTPGKRHFLTLGEAAKLTGYTKAAISKAIKEGRLSAYAKTAAGYQIDPAELTRVFPVTGQVDTILNRQLTPQVDTLQAKIEAAERLIAEHERTIYDLRKRLDDESAERRRLTAMLLPGPPGAIPDEARQDKEALETSSWWRRLWGK